MSILAVYGIILAYTKTLIPLKTTPVFTGTTIFLVIPNYFSFLLNLYEYYQSETQR